MSEMRHIHGFCTLCAKIEERIAELEANAKELRKSYETERQWRWDAEAEVERLTYHVERLEAELDHSIPGGGRESGASGAEGKGQRFGSIPPDKASQEPPGSEAAANPAARKERA